ncbi:ADP-ribose diphosphatase [Aliiglaciecola sp. 3_MG-2023]|uniref:ADP-ribose diphosphatase n=1 Tax=Aliiglaciecola sp. 3_MG-2023 TaxID=3062644 RepID=UPI0026E3FE73|nr:ADP-ribose diphosphatase [Aliiglaciecola sp. 3_MG-2023]MDO6692225.1 ADP-ribose diphosphatase [Aliiglaciecola sp. 3_MG-2023]
MKPFPTFGKDDLKISQTKSLYNGFFKLIDYQFTHRLFAGGWSQLVKREVLERGHAVAVLLFDPKVDEFVFIEQFRIGAFATSQSPWLIEIVAGMIEQGESIEEVCRREAFEEAGVTIKRLHKALSYLSSPGGTTERIHIYIGEVDASTAQGVHGLEHESEDILVRRATKLEAIDWLNEGKIDNAATLIALQWFLINEQKVRDIWHDNT